MCEVVMHCVLSVNLSCALVLTATSFMVSTAFVVGLTIVAINHAADISRLEASINDLDARLQAMDDDHNARFVVTHNMIADLRNETYSLIADLRNEMKQEIANLRSETSDNIAGMNSSLSFEIDSLRNDTDEHITNTTVPTIAFYARELDDTTPGNGDVMVYTDEVLNEGDGYNSTTGEFTAPLDGLYFFTITVCLQTSDKRFDVRFEVGGVSSYYYFYPYRTTSCYTGTSTHRMTRNTTALVKSSADHSSKAFTSGHYNAFSGFLINYLV